MKIHTFSPYYPKPLFPIICNHFINMKPFHYLFQTTFMPHRDLNSHLPASFLVNSNQGFTVSLQKMTEQFNTIKRVENHVIFC